MVSWHDPQLSTCREPGCSTVVLSGQWCHRHILLREGWVQLEDGRWRRPEDDGKTYTLKGAWRLRRGRFW